MANLKIGIIEDDLLIAEGIAMTLAGIGYKPIRPVRNYDDALSMLKNESPDLLLIDIILDGELDGINLAETVNKDYNIPFIFLTANSDRATVDRAKGVRPFAYLVKPFNEQDLFSAIEIAFSNYNQKKDKIEKVSEPKPYLKDFIFIKDGELFHKIEIDDILYIESDNVYLSLYTAHRHFVTRGKLDDFVSDFTNGNFFRVHRSYAINLKHLETINSLTVKVAGKEIPVNKVYRQELLRVINLIK